MATSSPARSVSEVSAKPGEDPSEAENTGQITCYLSGAPHLLAKLLM